MKEDIVDRNPTIQASGAFVRKDSRRQVDTPKMYGNDRMGNERQTSKFKSVFGEIPKPKKSRKY